MLLGASETCGINNLHSLSNIQIAKLGRHLQHNYNTVHVPTKNSAIAIITECLKDSQILWEIFLLLYIQGISASVGFAGVMGVAPSSAPESSAPQTLSQSTIIAIAVAGIVSVILLAVVILAVSVYTFRKRKQAKAESASADYVEVPAEDGNSFSSKWQPLKVSTRGDYEVVPTSFSKKDSESDANTHTAL